MRSQKYSSFSVERSILQYGMFNISDIVCSNSNRNGVKESLLGLSGTVQYAHTGASDIEV